MTRNLVAPETAEENRGKPGHYTFNAEIPDEYEGICFVIAALRLGDHAHLDIWSGRHVPAGDFEFARPTRHVGRAGRIILRWEEWIALRDVLDQHEQFLLREVENPTQGNLELHVGAT